MSENQDHFHLQWCSCLYCNEPSTVRIFDEKRGFFWTCTPHLVSMIFDEIDRFHSLHRISWDYCVGLGVDNASVNIGRHSSIMIKIHQKNPRFTLWDVLAIPHTVQQ